MIGDLAYRESSPSYVFLKHLMDVPEFMEDALCGKEPGEEVDFFLESDYPADIYICSSCPVIDSCSVYALSFGAPPSIGVWGGQEY